ncbi:sensor histidine kinase [Desulfosporosinus nitroreducens]|uniref:GHKL domain-containing protein n=1 Tax=Desulfosporosinus nitroreducens TaxID=2018668 RepID=A0ABT8QVD7_9FIRM|nr:GHKL domain-containing protein [Desulfosporosinus nitroreducens]MCO1602019.1 GHKL domain-containing protein [Desulfosporosinus nitroreducens]MDO0825313.1 GHKL domain-containing protein [Desulfosporosinus nitroreducens]
MFEKLYLVLGSIELLILFILIGKYIYFEKFYYNLRTWYFYLGTFLFSEVVVCFFDNGDPILIALPFLFFGVLIFHSRKKQKIRGVFLILPIAGMILSIPSIPAFFLYLFSYSNSMDFILNTDSPWMSMFDVLFWLSFIMFMWKRKKWIRFEEVVNNRTLSTWERNLINITGLFLLMLSILLLSVDELKIASLYAKLFVGFGICIIVFLLSLIIVMAIQGNEKTYFQQAAILNEHYLKAQLEHFRTYQETQRETRRVHHDMKNHIACLYNLISKEKDEEAKKYIMDLNSQVQQIDKELHTGNNIVDAIVNEKYVTAKKDQISFSIDGKLGNLTVDAIDLCTIFSNAIDNAVEALKDSSVSEKDIQIQFKQQNALQFLMFRNSIGQDQLASSFIRTKKGNINHGFGLGNIRMAVEKYQGHMEYHVENDGGQNFFVLEIILFVQPAT